MTTNRFCVICGKILHNHIYKHCGEYTFYLSAMFMPRFDIGNKYIGYTDDYGQLIRIDRDR